MKDCAFLLFAGERYALAQRHVLRVERLEGQQRPRADYLCLSALGEDISDAVDAHLLHLRPGNAGAPAPTQLLVHGRLQPWEAQQQDIVELPLRFYPHTPATALLLRAEQTCLILDPARLARLAAQPCSTGGFDE